MNLPAPAAGKALPLATYLTRLIWLCMAPLLLLAVWLAADSLREQEAKHLLEGANLSRNLATSIDQNLRARINALNMLALSPLADDPRHWPDLYAEAQGFKASFGTHVIFADSDRQMLFNTRLPYGAKLPRLQDAQGKTAAPLALETGRPQVGDIVISPPNQMPLVAIAVPVLREGRATRLMLSIFETTHFQARIDKMALPAGWSLAVRDGTGSDIARRAPPGFEARDVDDDHRFVVRSEHSPWSVVLEIPRGGHYTPLIRSIAILGAAILLATLLGRHAGTLASRRLGRQMRLLATPPGQQASAPEIAEIAAARRELDATAAATEAASTKRRQAEQALHASQSAALGQQQLARIAALNQMQDANSARQEAEAAAAEVRRLNADLERRVIERTTELTAANRELESFAYAVSHDLRAPLRALRGFAQALADDHGDQLRGEARIYLDQIGIASRKMGELIDGMLALSRSTRGELQRDIVDLSALARRRLEELACAEPARQVTIAVEGGLAAQGDARMIDVAMGNLLDNAWKYTARTARPHIRVYAEVRAGERWFCVADNGAGFNMDHIDRLFKPFQRLHRQDEFPGIGIGLATVQRIVHRHGGEIVATAEPGQGATFGFTLPAERQESNSMRNAPPPE